MKLSLSLAVCVCAAAAEKYSWTFPLLIVLKRHDLEWITNSIFLFASLFLFTLLHLNACCTLKWIRVVVVMVVVMVPDRSENCFLFKAFIFRFYSFRKSIRMLRCAPIIHSFRRRQRRQQQRTDLYIYFHFDPISSNSIQIDCENVCIIFSIVWPFFRFDPHKQNK